MKELIAIIQDIPVAHQSLIFCNSTLDDRQSLGAAGVADGDTLTLVLAVNTAVTTAHLPTESQPQCKCPRSYRC